MHQVIESFDRGGRKQQVDDKIHRFRQTAHGNGNEKGLNTVIRNLIGNAIKYSKQGGTVEVVVQKKPEQSKSAYPMPA